MVKALILGSADDFCRELHQVMNLVAPVYWSLEMIGRIAEDRAARAAHVDAGCGLNCLCQHLTHDVDTVLRVDPFQPVEVDPASEVEGIPGVGRVLALS